MKLFLSSFASILALSLMSFAPSAPSTSTGNTSSKQFTMQHLEGSETLELNSDHTFEYVNTTHQYHPVKIEGTWKFKEGTIVLDQASSLVRIPRKWQINSSGCLEAMVKTSESMQLCGN